MLVADCGSHTLRMRNNLRRTPLQYLAAFSSCVGLFRLRRTPVGPRGAQDEEEGRPLRRGKGGGQDAPGWRAEAPARGLVRVLRAAVHRDDVGGERTRPRMGWSGGGKGGYEEKVLFESSAA